VRLESALIWTFISIGLKYALKLAGNLILAHLLVPDEFGKAAIVFAIVSGVDALSDAGAQTSVIRGDRTDDDWLDTAWTIQVIRGLLICVIVWLMSYPVSTFYDEPDLHWMIAFASLSSLVFAFNPTSTMMAVKMLQMKTVSLIEVAGLAISYVVMIPLAFYTHSVWALLVGGTLGGLITMVMNWLILPKRKHRFRLERHAFHELFHFGKWIFAGSALGFIIFQGDRLTIGKLVGLHGLGIYFIAVAWTESLFALVGKVVQKLYLPVVSQYRARSDYLPKTAELRANVLKSLMIPFVFISGTAVPLIHFLYPERLSDAGLVLHYLVIGVWFSVIEFIYNDQFLSDNKPNRRAIAQAISIVFLAAGMFWYRDDLSTLSVSIIFVIAAAMRALILMAMYYRRDMSQAWPEIFYSLLFMVGAFGLHLIAVGLRGQVPDLVLLLATFGLLALPGAYLLYRSLYDVVKSSNLQPSST
jgi:O-antigen/teichoic acid export membrane protein